MTKQDRIIEMYSTSHCSECDMLAQYLHGSDNCFKQSIFNKTGCMNFLPNKDLIKDEHINCL